MSNDGTRTTAPDQARMARLGSGQWRAAVCVDEQGVETYWLLSPEPDQPAGCACSSCAPHEQLKPRTTA